MAKVIKKRKTKKKNTTKKSSTSRLIYVVWILFGILAALIITIMWYVFSQKPKPIQTPTLKNQTTLEPSKKSQDDINTRLKDVLKKKRLPPLEPKDEPKEELKQKEPIVDAKHELDAGAVEPIKKEKSLIKTKPILAIIIDDVSTKSQVDRIKSTGLTLNMSFLPPSKQRPSSHLLAQKEPFYMVHLPMEALHFNAEEPHTLRVSDSKEMVYKRVQKIKELFPQVKYINNHTGSKFTSDKKAVQRLYDAFEAQGINLIDSRTIASSKIEEVMHEHGKKYVGRDIFLDHEQDKNYVKNQIKLAIKFAKNHGSAIAIGHPHKNTIEALKESKKLFDEVELVQIDRLYE
ncbi:MAG: divergent polysaccharide deacetylase family protein [Sulfurimonas sp.]|jgi:polysaccharide deacetylase 2 family uncharacterized protein YibQ|nr:divergent polysaccharide deacetylase family protein [Sulfurimonadaceae bacterium]